MNQRLSDARETAGLTIGQAARLLDIKVSRLQEAEAGGILPDELAQHMADIYGVSVEFLNGGEPADLIEDFIAHKGVSDEELIAVIVKWCNPVGGIR